MQAAMRQPESPIEIEPVQAVTATRSDSAYKLSGDFMARTDELLVDYDSSDHKLVVAYEMLRSAREARGRLFNNTDSALAAGDASYEQVVLNAALVWPVKNLGRPSWPNAPY